MNNATVALLFNADSLNSQSNSERTATHAGIPEENPERRDQFVTTDVYYRQYHPLDHFWLAVGSHYLA